MKKRITLKQRKENLRRERTLFLIVCEGEKTERLYFKEFRRRNNGIRIEVPNCSYTDPLSLLKFTQRMKSVYDIDIKRGDRVWCVFDVDQNAEEIIQRTAREAKKNKIKIILSNPCFELWYLLHFEFSTAFMSTTQAAQKLKSKYISSYHKNKSYFDRLKPHISTAVENAQKLNDYHDKNQTALISSESNPSTQAFELVQHIMDLI